MLLHFILPKMNMHVIYINYFVIFSASNYFKYKSYCFLNYSGIIDIITEISILCPVDKPVEYVNNSMNITGYCVGFLIYLQIITCIYKLFHS